MLCRSGVSGMAAAGTASAPAPGSSEAASGSGRGFAYTAYEANAWEATFFKSGELQHSHRHIGRSLVLAQIDVVPSCKLTSGIVNT